MTTLYLNRTLDGNLTPADDFAREKLRKIKPHSTVKADIRQARDSIRHKKYWVLCTLVWQNSEQFGSPEEVSDYLKILAGHCSLIASQATGEVYKLPKSMSFAAMDQTQFEDFWARVTQAVCEHVIPTLSLPALEFEVLKLVGYAGGKQ